MNVQDNKLLNFIKKLFNKDKNIILKNFFYKSISLYAVTLIILYNIKLDHKIYIFSILSIFVFVFFTLVHFIYYFVYKKHFMDIRAKISFILLISSFILIIKHAIE